MLGSARLAHVLARVDWDRFLKKCPGAVAGFPPPPEGFGAIDVDRRLQFEATKYLLDRGAKYLTPDTSPIEGCFRLRFKFGRLSRVRQLLEDRRSPGAAGNVRSREPVTPVPEPPQAHRSVAFQVGKLLGRRFR